MLERIIELILKLFDKTSIDSIYGIKSYTRNFMDLQKKKLILY